MIKLTKKSLKLIAGCEGEGFKCVTDLIAAAIMDSVSPGICMNEGCSYVTEVEPDQSEGYCENCDECSVTSALVLAGVI
jgi:hypothetical protein